MAEICQVMNTEFEKGPKECDGVLLFRLSCAINRHGDVADFTSVELIELQSAQP